MSDNAVLDQDRNPSELHLAYLLRATDRDRARVSLTNLAEQGSVGAMLYLGEMDEELGPDNYLNAKSWFKLAYECGSNSGRNHLAWIEHQLGNMDQAKALWLEGVADDDNLSIVTLGSLHAESNALELRMQGKILLEKASKKGFLLAKYRLAVFLIKGRFGFLRRIVGFFLLMNFFIRALKTGLKNPENLRKDLALR